MAANELRLELLLGRRVLAGNGRSIGRIEEICAMQSGRRLVVEEVHVGSYAILERFSAWGIGRALLRQVGARKGGYRVPWDKLDVSSDPPRLKCAATELKPLGE
jgi:sporulation protein YlmC with PRC-barrel domain